MPGRVAPPCPTAPPGALPRTDRPSAVARALAGALGVAVPALLAAVAPARGEERAVWVTRYDYRTAEDVREIVANVAALGASRVLFQVRGNGSVYYPSELEPWTEAWGGEDPGFDPLAVAVEEARARGIALEAWMNAMPLWKGRTPPTDARHPLVRHPEWRVVRSDGVPQPFNDHYVCANPARDDVREHVAAMAGEIASRYAVDGIHLDYIRYVSDLDGALDVSYDAVSLERFGGDPAADPEGWRRFKAEQVTATVRAIRAAVSAARPGCRLSAAVLGLRDARARCGQDPERWAREGLVDALYPMCYADRADELARRLGESAGIGGGSTGVPVVVGLGVFRHADPAVTRAQVAAARAASGGGVALFCYAALHGSRDESSLACPDETLRAARRALIRELWSREPRRAEPR